MPSVPSSVRSTGIGTFRDSPCSRFNPRNKRLQQAPVVRWTPYVQASGCAIIELPRENRTELPVSRVHFIIDKGFPFPRQGHVLQVRVGAQLTGQVLKSSVITVKRDPRKNYVVADFQASLRWTASIQNYDVSSSWECACEAGPLLFSKLELLCHSVPEQLFALGRRECTLLAFHI